MKLEQQLRYEQMKYKIIINDPLVREAMETGGRVMSESRVIYKYILGESKVIEIPENPVFLKVAVQGEVTVLWVLVDPHNEKKSYQVATVFTGWPFRKDSINGLDYIGTVQIKEIVQHWFIGLKVN